MIIKNAEILNGTFRFANADLKITDDKITDIGDISSFENEPMEDELDLDGLRVIPGLIDLHIHGSAGGDVCDADRGSIEAMSKYLAENGITSFAPASMAVSVGQLSKTFAAVREAMDNPPGGAYLHGINMEGPYFSPEKRGAQNPAYIHNPDIDEFRRLYDGCGGIIKLVDVAPETEHAEEFIREASRLCVVSVAHTTAGYDQTMKAFSWGARHATHLYNAMTPLNHREPGTVGAIFDSGATAEMICDGIHLHPAAIRIAWRLLGPDRVVLISDAMAAAGMPDGEYELGGLKVIVKGNAARLPSGNLAGSTSNLMKNVKNAIRFGITPENAIKAATINPARVLKCDRYTGSIEPGKSADLVVIDRDFNVKTVIIKGKIYKR